jgi:hypothetical protein
MIDGINYGGKSEQMDLLGVRSMVPQATTVSSGRDLYVHADFRRHYRSRT